VNALAESGTCELELHGAKACNCLRAAIGLSEARLLYKTRHVDLGRGEQRAFFYFTSDVIALNGAAFSLRGAEFFGAAATLTEQYLAANAASERFLIDNEFMGGASFSIADRPSSRCPNRMTAFDDKREAVNYGENRRREAQRATNV
jgi:glutathione S-transferase